MIPEDDGVAEQARRSYHVRVQKSRLAVSTLAGAVGAFGRAVGALSVPYATSVVFIAVAGGSALLFIEAYRHGLDRRLGVRLEPLWMGLDVAFISFGVYATGGASSPFFLWYLANAAAAAFVAGWRWAVTIGLLNSLAYFATLAAMGEIGFLDPGFWQACTRMGFLYAAAFFFLRGVSRLQADRLLIRRLQREQALKVEQLIALTQDLDQGTRALAEANMQIREADRMKSQFLANMSHELRTPLNSIIGFSEILLERLVGQVPTKYIKFLNNIHTSGQHLLAIINDILDLSKVEAGKMELHPEQLRIHAVAEGVLNVMHGMASKAQIRFELDVPEALPAIETDAAKFKQVLYNLLSNAVKFSPHGSTVRIVARAEAAAASPLGVDSLVISVKDQGIGISTEDQEVIFHEFRQADGGASRTFGGTGLGLALVKKFVELQGGEVSLESEVGRGSTFSVTLPLQPQGKPGEAPRLQPPRWLPAEHRVLVVEDDLLAFQALARLLGAAGYFPVRARHGEEALDLARSLKPTCITLDLALPGLSGLDVLKELKRDPRTREIPVVIISMMDNRELGLALGALDYFTKPVDRERLIARLREVAPVPAPGKRRILVVDDDPQVHALLDAALEPLGYHMDHAGTGGAGLEQARAERPDVIVLDLVMPDVTGFDVAAALQESEETAQIPIVILTAKDLEDAERARLEGKVAALVRKGGATPARLLAAIRELEGRVAQEASGAR